MFFVCLLLATLPPNVQLRIEPDEANAVLAILDERAAERAIDEKQWQSLFATEGYVRLQKREHSMKRSFENDDFKKFAMSDEVLARRQELRRVMSDWSHANLNDSERSKISVSCNEIC